MAFDDDHHSKDVPDAAAASRATAGSVQTERASSILRDIARALGIPAKAFFAPPTDTHPVAIAELIEAADLLARFPSGTARTRLLDLLRRDDAKAAIFSDEKPILAS